ncbi:organic cation transporter protein-like [Dendronephthya gigantea]|uniref:organic cation transporter protein-like n=1 Tax=Dendronephthya gigantea TaxID=151771 RepID=UPI00106B3FD2|nr:organic cation transporter protein-like [Dendronephthya gigantea]
MDKVEELFKNIGDPGKFQMLSYFCLATNLVYVMCNHLLAVFLAAKTPHHCTLAANQTLRDFIPLVVRDNKEQFDGCSIYTKYSGNESEPCRNGWTYDLEERGNTIISEFDLVCDDAYKSELSTTVYFGGVLVGSLIYGFLADKYGRKPTLAVSQLSGGILSFGIFIFRNYYAFVTLRFFLGIQTQAAFIVSFVLALELFQTKYRARAGVFFGIISVTGGMVLGILAYLIRDWRYIQLAISFIPFIQLLLLCFVPESIRWLIVHKRFDKVENVVRRIVHFNKLPYPEEIMRKIGELDFQDGLKSRHDRKANVLDLYRTPSLRMKSFILIIVWFTISAAFFGLAFNISFLFGDKYVNFFISEATDMCGVLLMFWAVPKFGRRRPLALAFLICGIANVISVVTTAVESDATGVKILGTATALLGKSSAISTMNVAATFTAELYPTVIRNLSLGVNNAWTRVGGMLSPQIFLLGAYTATFVPFAILGVLSLASAFLIMLLPETHNKSLMDTIQHEKRKECAKTKVEEDERFQLQNVEERQAFVSAES